MLSSFAPNLPFYARLFLMLMKGTFCSQSEGTAPWLSPYGSGKRMSSLFLQQGEEAPVSWLLTLLWPFTLTVLTPCWKLNNAQKEV